MRCDPDVDWRTLSRGERRRCSGPSETSPPPQWWVNWKYHLIREIAGGGRPRRAVSKDVAPEEDEEGTETETSQPLKPEPFRPPRGEGLLPPSISGGLPLQSLVASD